MPARFAIPLLVATLIATVPGCTQPPIEPEIEWGVTTCHRCGSTIDDRRWAAADRSDGHIRPFDDPGCLFLTRRQQGANAPDAVFSDHLSGERWLAAADAWFATTDRSQSPRGFNWAAYPSFAAAQDVVTAAGSGRIVRYAEAMQAIPAAP